MSARLFLYQRMPTTELRSFLRFSWILLGASILASGCRSRGGADLSSSADGSPISKGVMISYQGGEALKLDPQSLKLASLTTYEVTERNLAQALPLSGQIAANDSDSVQVTSRLPGKITGAFVSVGSAVKAGQIIATVDSVDLAQAEATYRTALAHEELTLHQLDQQKNLARYGMFSEQPVEDAQRGFAAAQASVASDKEQIALDKTALDNAQQLVQMGEITHKPVEDAQNAYAQVQSALSQARTTLNSAKSSLDRAKVLYKGGVFSLQQQEDAQTAYDNATASADQAAIQEHLAKAELDRQEEIYKKDLNGASALQEARSKLQQDQHAYQNDLTSLSLARVELSRARTVHGSKIPVTQALQQAQDAYDESKVALQGAADELKLYGVTPGMALAQLNRGDSVIPITSPIAGIVATRGMAVGQIIDTTTPLVKVLNLSRVYIDAQVFEQDLVNVAVGDPIRAKVASFPNRTFAGRLSVVGKEVDPDTRTVLARSEIANPDSSLRPGMYATVTVGRRERRMGLAFPSSAILQEGNRSIVFVQVGKDEFVKRTVEAGPAVEGYSPALKGLNDGDRVVVNGAPLLQAEQERIETEKGASS